MSQTQQIENNCRIAEYLGLKVERFSDGPYRINKIRGGWECRFEDPRSALYGYITDYGIHFHGKSPSRDPHAQQTRHVSSRHAGPIGLWPIATGSTFPNDFRCRERQDAEIHTLESEETRLAKIEKILSEDRGSACGIFAIMAIYGVVMVFTVLIIWSARFLGVGAL